MAYENASYNCKNILKAVCTKPETTIAEMIELCQILWTKTYKTKLLTAALKAPNKKKCCVCGKQGHLKRDFRSLPNQPDLQKSVHCAKKDITELISVALSLRET